MSDISVFLKDKKKATPNVKVAVCDDFKDENGNAIEWEIKKLTTREISDARTLCTQIKNVKGKGPGEFVVDSERLLRVLTAKSVVYPDLTDKTIADSYMSEYPMDERTPENLVMLMLSDKDDFEKLAFAVTKLNNLVDKIDDENEAVTLAKN
ncbi:MAG: hypothetical protein M0R48_11140 [Candidatus Omnitrophica bacterium]|nr:hypothetical protein [Candidatus Omnitrophota bacterium]